MAGLASRRGCAAARRRARRRSNSASARCRHAHFTGEAVQQEFVIDARRHPRKQRSRELRELRAAVDARQVRRATSCVTRNSEIGSASAMRASKASAPSAPTSVSGSSPSGRNRNRSWRPSRACSSAILERAPGGVAARVVAVEAEDELARHAEEAIQVLGRRRRAERRDGVRNARLRETHDVHVAFDDQQPLDLPERLSRLVESVELAPLVEERRLRRVEVLRFALVEDAAAEGNRPAARVADREHHAVAEPVVETGFALPLRSMTRPAPASACSRSAVPPKRFSMASQESGA